MLCNLKVERLTLTFLFVIPAVFGKLPSNIRGRGNPTRTELGLPIRKNVLVVVDVINGYDASFVEQLQGPGGKEYITRKHNVSRAFWLGDWNSRHDPSRYHQTSRQVNYDKGWNAGLPSKLMNRIVGKLNSVIGHGWDLIVYAHDFLDPEALGTFELDNKTWTDPQKEIALVRYGDYTSITAHSQGAEVHSNISPHPQCEPRDREAPTSIFNLSGLNVLCFRKQTDNAFDAERDEQGRPKTVDVDGNGKPKVSGVTLLERLKAAELGPDKAVLTFAGLETHRCVKASLVASCMLGYKTRVLQSAIGSESDALHQFGLEMIRKECPTVEILDATPEPMAIFDFSSWLKASKFAVFACVVCAVSTVCASILWCNMLQQASGRAQMAASGLKLTK